MVKKYQRNERVILRKCGDFCFLIDPRLSYNEDDEYIGQLNDVGVLIWNSIITPKQVDDIVKIILDNISDEKTKDLINVIRNDVICFLQELTEYSYVKVTSRQ